MSSINPCSPSLPWCFRTVSAWCRWHLPTATVKKTSNKKGLGRLDIYLFTELQEIRQSVVYCIRVAVIIMCMYACVSSVKVLQHVAVVEDAPIITYFIQIGPAFSCSLCWPSCAATMYVLHACIYCLLCASRRDVLLTNSIRWVVFVPKNRVV